MLAPTQQHRFRDETSGPEQVCQTVAESDLLHGGNNKTKGQE